MTRPNYPRQLWAILDENNRVIQEVTLEEWCKWIVKSRHKRILARDTIDQYVVSTIFLGLNHQYMPGGRPLYWETMIFDPLGRVYGDYQDRSSTAKEALKGHAQAIEWLKDQISEIRDREDKCL